jgi:uncharacterized damage-inducible protein DinB
MSRKPHVERMAEYNAWMNSRLYATAGRLPADELARDRRAFFGSILGTLNHIVVADTTWLQRFAGLPGRHAALDPLRAMPPQVPMALDAVSFPDFDALSAHRAMLDAMIEHWVATLTEDDLGQVLHYANTRGDRFDRELFALLMHFFNHQTHHRGQATTLLSQAGIDVGVTDLLALVPNAGAGDAAEPQPH